MPIKYRPLSFEILHYFDYIVQMENSSSFNFSVSEDAALKRPHTIHRFIASFATLSFMAIEPSGSIACKQASACDGYPGIFPVK
jgi:hypothetical protein